MWLDIKNGVLASTVYADGQLVAKDVAFSLPAITLMSADVQAMGTLSLPLVGLIENMEATITKIGMDQGLTRLSRLDKQNIEFRWVQNVLKSDGTTAPEGCKAFLRTIASALPGASVEIGAATEGDITYSVTRLQIYVGGEEYLLVDRLSQILRIDGKDYMSAISSLL